MGLIVWIKMATVTFMYYNNFFLIGHMEIKSIKLENRFPWVERNSIGIFWSKQGSLSPTSMPSTAGCYFWWVQVSYVSWYCTAVLIFIYIMISEIEPFFTYFGHLYLLLEEVSFHVFSPFFLIWLFL